MAIVVEEEKKNSHVFGIVGWLVFLVALGASAYYVFFAPAPAVTLPLSGGLNSIAPLAQSPVQPQTVEANPVLTSLSTTIAAPTSSGPVAVKRTNPFLAP